MAETRDNTGGTVGELAAIDGVPENREERLAHLQAIAKDSNSTMTHCPECGIELANIDPVAHAASHWPITVPSGAMSDEAFEREQALYRTAGAKVPRRV